MIDIVFLPSSETSLLNSFKELGKVYLWGISICIVNYIFFDLKNLRKWFVIIGGISTLFLFIQFLMWLIGGSEINGIISLGLLQPYHIDYSIGSGSFYTSFYRPSSFFSEPAFYANFILSAIVLVLVNSNGINKKQYIFIISFFSLGILVSSSTAGIVLLFILFCLYYKNYILKNLYSFLIGLLVFISILGVVYFNLESFDESTYLGKSIVTINRKFEVMDHSRRFGRSYDALDYLKEEQKIFGVGMGNEINILPPNSDSYMNTVTMMIFSVGVVGLGVFMIFITGLLLSAKNYVILFLFISYLAKCVNGSIGFSLYGILFLGLAIFLNCYYSKENNYNKFIKSINHNN